MNKLRSKLLAIFLTMPFWGVSQNDNRGECYNIDPKSLEQIVEDLRFIASSDMGGRLAGSSEEEMVINFIIERFSELGLQPYGDYYEWAMNAPGLFPVAASEDTHLRWKKFNPKLGKAFFPTSMSSNDELKMRTRFVRYGMEIPDAEYSNFTGRKKRLKKRIAVIDIGTYQNKKSEQVLTQTVKERVEAAIRYGAKGVILINPSMAGIEPAKEFENIEGLGVPVVMLRNPVMIKRLKKWWGRTVELKVDQTELPTTFRNVSAYLDNGAAMTVLITANMDHIGKGNRFSRAPGSNTVHFGADNNASGVVALLELARQLANDRASAPFNYLFVITSGSSDQYGAKYLTDWLPKNFEGMTTFAIYYNMVGRLSDTRELEIQGIGSFDANFMPTFAKKISCFDISLIQRGQAPGNGDHQVLINNEIPTIKITSGMHDDYNLPSDEVGRINIEGIAQIVSITRTYLQKFNPDYKTIFSDGFSQRGSTHPAEPKRVDWGFEAEWEHRKPGIMIKKLQEGGAAERAGLQNGDIITQIGQYPIEDIYHFMDYLQILQPGESRFIRYTRNGQVRPAVINF